MIIGKGKASRQDPPCEHAAEVSDMFRADPEKTLPNMPQGRIAYNQLRLCFKHSGRSLPSGTKINVLHGMWKKVSKKLQSMIKYYTGLLSEIHILAVKETKSDSSYSFRSSGWEIYTPAQALFFNRWSIPDICPSSCKSVLRFLRRPRLQLFPSSITLKPESIMLRLSKIS